MRYVVGFVLVIPLVVSPLGATAQAGDEPVPKVALGIRTQHRLPPQLMLRAGYYLYLDADADSDAKSDRAEPSAEEPKISQAVEEDATPLEEPVSSAAPGTDVPDIDTLSERSIEQYETRPAQPNRRRKRAIALGVTIPILVVGSALLIGGAVAVSNMEF
jgi:hypothetical protein